MEIKNLERAIEAKKELTKLSDAIDTLKTMSRTNQLGLIISEWGDCSGCCVAKQFKSGDYHPMYKEIVSLILEKFEDAKSELESEILSL